MATPAETYFRQVIAECRLAFDRTRPGLLGRLGLWRGRGGDRDGVDAHLRPHYDTLGRYGRVVWGAVAQVNVGMFAPGAGDLPGVTVYGTDGFYDTHPHDLAAIGRACFEFKDTAPADDEFRAVAERLTDEFDQTPRTLVPGRLADGREVFLGSTLFHRARLPGGVLSAGVFPMVIAPDRTEINMVLPLDCWPGSLRSGWDTLRGRLEELAVTTTALRVARDAAKRPADTRVPDWDVDAIPVRVTPAMAAACRRIARENGLPPTLRLVVGFRDDGTRCASFADGYDPATEESFTSNGVAVVVRKDQRDRLRGAVVDYQSSAFATGVVIRLPGE